MSAYLLTSTVMMLMSLIALGYTFRQLQVARRHLRILNSHRIAAHSAIQKSRMDLLEVRNRAKLLEDTVSGGASAVEKVHKAISNTTFGLIDLFSRDEEFRESARKARQTHDNTSENVYKTVRTTNRALHILADTLIIGKAEKKIASRKPGGNGSSE
ncbi:hypothetical protein [Marinobacter sp. F4206]|uniref:hypothetical protein n=1 Tax=Marinobacter sp. F4206 TaxID=2861777 RepID=UPI001C5CE723|nr:hypothetical protein [Marinobacter sp. F4206]MBW4933241.1 hypothetical protein [Marinobacter sp. F4206]